MGLTGYIGLSITDYRTNGLSVYRAIELTDDGL